MTTPPLGDLLLELIGGHMKSGIVRATAELGVVDVFGAEARPAKEVAGELGLPVDSIRRLLRALTVLGLFVEPEDDHFAVLPEGELLRRDHPASYRTLAELYTDPLITRPWEKLATGLRTGQPTFESIFGLPLFERLAAEPTMSAFFNATMSEATHRVAATAPAAYDFGRFNAVLDIGGGDGTLLTAILAANPGLRGTVLDSAEGAAQAPARYAEAGLTDRASVLTGDFFAGIPEGYDLHVIKSILHDWPDDRCELILSHSRATIPADGRLLIVEMLLPERAERNVARSVYFSDLTMLLNLGARERTRADFETLFQRAGYELTTAHALPAETQGVWLLEGRPV
ncbi:methyltransferase [Kribbella albertanoniae]|uniref:Methyltransferase n=1 Tax=Kribbella albertanoniae TaxID=1266829 RepID=A0A4V2XSX7_9ACTN|nr:methyltransferase [Kribbella albertanoniae]TDC35475.1 methyltransferase [Kribbella albertanoniae]